MVLKESFSEEYTRLLNNEEIKIYWLKKWCLFFEENNIIRESGTLIWAKISYEWKHYLNIILSAKNHITTLLVREYNNHEHLGSEYIEPNIRRIYWILKVRSIIMEVGTKCILCQMKIKTKHPGKYKWSIIWRIRTYEISIQLCQN